VYFWMEKEQVLRNYVLGKERRDGDEARGTRGKASAPERLSTFGGGWRRVDPFEDERVARRDAYRRREDIYNA
jgi:hypothetical protein